MRPIACVVRAVWQRNLIRYDWQLQWPAGTASYMRTKLIAGKAQAVLQHTCSQPQCQKDQQCLPRLWFETTV